MSHKSFLILQGPATPFFSELADTIQQQGYPVLHIAFCGGDRLFRGHTPHLEYTGTTDQLPQWIQPILLQRNITDCILFGDTRAIHTALKPTLQQFNIRLHVYEEGYFRPNWITLEKNGVNAHSEWMHQSADSWLNQAQQLALPTVSHRLQGNFKFRALYDFSYRLANGLMFWRYRHYKSHRPLNGLLEYLGWSIRFPQIWFYYQRRNDASIQHLIEAGIPYFVLPLQLESDAQIHTHSPFSNNKELLEYVLASFSQHAPVNAQLVIKNHPLSTGIPDHRRILAQLGKEYQLQQRIIYLETGHLSPLLKHAQGTVVVNSTSAMEAMAYGSPLKALGLAIYNIDGLCYQGSLDQFWTQAKAPDADLFRAMKRVLIEHTQLNGDFYSPLGRRLAVMNSLPKLGINTRKTLPIQQCIVITGASQGIGAALARHYAKPGVKLGLIARDSKRLEQIADICRCLGAETHTAALDVSQAELMTDWINEFDQQQPIDLLITSAGVTLALDSEQQLEPLEQSLALIDINLKGTLNTVHPVVTRMRQRKRGQIALISSLAAYYGMPITPVYSASKAAIKSYGEALRGLLATEGIQVSIICPGFVKSDLSDRFPGPRPWMLSADQAAQRIAKGLKRNRAIIAFPWVLALGMKSLQWMPFKLASFFMGLSGYNRAHKGREK